MSTTADGDVDRGDGDVPGGLRQGPHVPGANADGLHYHESASADQPQTVDQALATLKTYTGKGG